MAQSVLSPTPRHGQQTDRGRAERLRRLAYDRPPAGGRLVEATDGGRVRGVAGDLGIALGLGEDLVDRVGERIEALFGLRLRRLEHQRLVDQQRKVDGRW